MSQPLQSKPKVTPGHALPMVEFLLNLETHLHPTLLQLAQGCLIDALGCGLFGAKQPWGLIMREEALNDQSQGHCTLLGHSQTVSASLAALCNGTAIHGFELDDLLSEAVIHPGAVIIPVVLAVSEAVNASGMDVLRGIIAGYEATARISLALGMTPSLQGFHKTSVVGPVAGAIAASVTMKLDLEQTLCAIGLACSCSSGVKNFAAGSGGGMVKRMHAGHAAESAVRMSLLAQRGFTAPHTALDGHFGLLDVYSGEHAKPELLDHQLGHNWAVQDVWVKVYPVCGWIQGVAQLLTEMKDLLKFGVNDIEKIIIATSSFAAKNNSNPQVTDTMEAQYSIPYCVAVCLTGDPSNPDEFDTARLADPMREALAKRVEVLADLQADLVYPKQFACKVSVYLRNGEVHESQTNDPLGTSGNPLNDNQKMNKFIQLANNSGLGDSSLQIAKALNSISTLKSIRDFTRLLR